MTYYPWPPVLNFQPVIDSAPVAYGLGPNYLGAPPFGANTMAPTRIYNPLEEADVFEVEVFEPHQQKTQRGTAMQPQPNPGRVYANPWSYPYLYGGFGYGPYGGYYGYPYWPTTTPWGGYAWPYGAGYPYVYPYPYGGYPYYPWGGAVVVGGHRRPHGGGKRLPVRGGGRRRNPEGDADNPLAYWSTPYYWAGYGGYPWGGGWGYPWGAYGYYPYWGYPAWGGYWPYWGGGFWGGGFGKFGGGAKISGGGGFGPGVTISGGGGGGGVTISNPYQHPNVRSLLAA